MGIIQNDTNNIILDAVVTDAGRQLLARNDGSFSIAKFALSDDEVNYSWITKYGRTVGKERIEKLTLNLEALTNQQQAQKYRLISVSNPNLIRLPILSLSGDSNVNGTAKVVTLGKTVQKTAAITLEQTISNESSIDVELRDQVFQVEMNALFLQVQRAVPDSVDGYQRATYLLPRSPAENALGGSVLQFTLNVKNLSESQFQIFGTSSNKQLITSIVRVTGLSSGSVSEFVVQINKSL